MKLKELASLTDGEIIGPPQSDDIEITGVSGINEAKKGDITFVSSKKFIKDLPGCKASCVIVKEPVSDLDIIQLKVSNPYFAFAKLLEYFYIKPHKCIGISKDAFVSDKSKIATDVSIFPFSYISEGASVGTGTVIYPHVFIGENTIVGERCIIYPNVTLREGIKVGNRVIIHSGSVIGSDGFGYVFEKGRHYKIPQVGGVIVEDDVEIGSNVSIDRATTGNTIIGSGTKIDNLVQIGHNVKIGKNSIIIAQVAIGGSTEIGNYVTLAGQVGVADHAKIASETMIGAQSGIMGNVSKGVYSGSPAMPHREWLKASALFAKLPELYKKIRELEEKIKKLKGGN
ncbi:MAG: UDP-3-O-(3-hydroxymyristoyl)glucosamine N-acyltransferase [Nitrospirae bacterium RBG_13_39_12]|nr:MAG: UDP-3-O-(3-hydroxymyristoyl)glucosamine N-acyltransferase [Nitrospirae bacterium RBG_13_39_12]